MSNVCKYNIYKAVSSLLTFGTPIITLLCCGDFIVHRSDTAISAAGIFVLLLLSFFAKDKLLENFKVPSAFILASVLFVLILMIENIIVPTKTVCIATMCLCAVDEITFKRLYKNAEFMLPKAAAHYKHFGFIFAKNKTILEAEKCQAELSKK